MARSGILKLTRPKLLHYIHEHTGGALNNGNISELRKSLLTLEKETEARIIAGIM